jgi:multiple sugar transport system permease protein
MLDDTVETLLPSQEVGMPRGWESIWNSPMRVALVGLVAIGGLLPLAWMISLSLRTVAEAIKPFVWIPSVITSRNYTEIFRTYPLFQWLGNSLLVVAAAVPLTVITASLAGFALTALPARQRNVLIIASVAALLVPAMALWVPRFLIYKTIHIYDSPLALIAPAFTGTSPLYVLVFAWAFSRVPPASFEQARLDGAGPLRVWWSIGMPQVLPAIGAVAVLSMVTYWSDYLSPLLYINNQEYYTLPVGVQVLQQAGTSGNTTTWPLIMAGAVVLTLPVLILFFIAQRFFFQLGRS